MIGAFFEALLTAGLPIGALTFVLYFWTFQAGLLHPSSDRKTLKTQMRGWKRDVKSGDKNPGNPLQKQWLRFGGGFYGVVALFTFILIEADDIFTFFRNFESIAHFIETFGVHMIIDMLVQGLKNFISAIVWPVYWLPELDTDHPFTWLVATYSGYWIGLNIAKRRAEALSNYLESDPE